jgi:hypothetical protein
MSRFSDLSDEQRDALMDVGLGVLRWSLGAIAAARAKGVDLEKLVTAAREDNEEDVFDKLGVSRPASGETGLQPVRPIDTVPSPYARIWPFDPRTNEGARSRYQSGDVVYRSRTDPTKFAVAQKGVGGSVDEEKWMLVGEFA